MKAELECGVPDERKREGPKVLRTVYVRTVYVRRVVEPEGVIKCLTVRNLISPGGCRKASAHTAAFSHFRHIEPSSGWVGCRRGEETAPGLGCLRTLPPEGGVPGSREETAPCPACPPGKSGAWAGLASAGRSGEAAARGSSRWIKTGAAGPRFRSRALAAGKCRADEWKRLE